MLEKQLRERNSIEKRAEQRRSKVCTYVLSLLILLILLVPTISKAIIIGSTLTVTKSGGGTGTVTSGPAGINCGGDCSEIYGDGTVVALTATPDPGSVFGGWGGDPDCFDGLVLMDIDKTCTALFQPPSVGWELFPIGTPPANAGSYNSIAIDSNDKVHIAYEARQPNGINGDLRYVTNATGAWVTTPVDSSGGVGISATIALDSNNRAHIGYHDRTTLDLKYATNATGSWVATTVDSSGDVGAAASIAIDSRNNVHIIYHDYTVGVNLKYATNATGQWVTSTIDSSGGLCPGGLMVDVAVDSIDKLHIVYCDASGGIKYANNVTGPWVATTVDALGGSDVSIGTDSRDDVHISYYQINNVPLPGFGDLKYATNATGEWVTATIDESGDTGGRTSLAIDQNDKVYISYYDFSNRDIRYATNVTGAWVMETVDSGNVGEFTATSIALDSKAKAHISYFSRPNFATTVNDDLMYATNARFTLTITNSGFGAGTVTSNPLGINCGADCSELYDAGTVVTLTATPDAGSLFAGWGGDADCSDGQVTMNGRKTCIATFNSLLSTLTVNKSGLGAGTVTSDPPGINCGADCLESYNTGTVVTLTATPDAGSFFAGWSGDADCSDGNVAMNGNKTCIAAFSLMPPVTLTVNKAGTGSGTIGSSPAGIACGADCSELYAAGTVVTLTATADPGFVFGGWSGDADCTDGNITMNGNKTCIATFDYPVTPVFADVPFNHWAYNMIMAISEAGITGGCSTNPPSFCPDNTLTRGQMAVFIEAALAHPGNACTGRFADVPIGNPFCGFVERMADDGITSGCGGVNFCPDAPVTRGQMAVFIEAALGHTSATCTGLFADVATGHPFCRFIEHLATDGITSGCGSLSFCPDNPVTRAQMAVFLVAAPDPLLP